MVGFSTVAQFLARLILGVIFIAHGWQKLHTNGIDATATFFKSLDIPMPTTAAYVATWVELDGGIFLIIGLLLPLVAVLLILDMLGAIYYVHWDNGFWATNGGWEWPAALIAGLLAVGFAPSGRAAVDGLVMSRRRRSRATVDG